MSTDPDLDQHTAVLRSKLAQSLVDSGDLTDPAWRAAFERVPRHVFVPRFYGNDGRTLSDEDPETREEWLAAVYDDRSLVTHRTDGSATSSSTMPSLMAEMLEALQITDDAKVLEIGTGTGYNAALLAHRLGNANVTTIDVSSDITTPARQRLISAGYRPRVLTGDGTLGAPDAAPFNAIEATVGITHVPLAWLDQLDTEGVILAPIGLGLARICRIGRRRAAGKFIGPAAFMPLRRDGESGIPAADLASLDDAPKRPTGMPASVLLNSSYRFMVSLDEPGLVWQYHHDDGALVGARVWSADGSIAALHSDGTVTEAGPRRLWTALESTYATFTEHNQPGRERFHITIDSEYQHVWLDVPGGTDPWPLPA